MKILIKATWLFLFGIYVEYYKRRFDTAMDKCIKNGGDISCRTLTKKSNKSYSLYMKFREYENDLKREINIKKLIKDSI